MPQVHTRLTAAFARLVRVLTQGETLALAFIAIGTGLRLAYFLPPTSLWGDEAALALNLSSRSPLELLAPLVHNQHAPLGFLLVEDALHSMCGLDERCLRLPALLASVLSLPAFWLLLRPLPWREARWLSVALLALSPGAVRYAAELKPYSLDLLATLLVLAVAFVYVTRPVSARQLAAWSVLGAVLVWFSFASVIVLFAAGVVLGTHALAVNRSRVPGLAAALLLPAASFAVQFWLVGRHSVENDRLASFWSPYFLPFPPASLWDVRHTLDLLMRPFRNPLGLLDVAIPSAVAAIGLVSLARWNQWHAALLALPVTWTAAFSAADLWPYEGRLILFLIPLLATPLACGVTALTAGNAFARAVLIGALLVGPITGTREVMERTERSGVRDVLAATRAEVRPDDVLYLYYKSDLPFAVYAPGRWPATVRVVTGSRIDGDADIAAREMDRLTGHQRVWVLLSEVNTFWTDERQLLLRLLDLHGRRLLERQSDGASLYLYDLTRVPRAEGRATDATATNASCCASAEP